MKSVFTVQVLHICTKSYNIFCQDHFFSFYLMFIIDFPYSNLFVRLLSVVKKTFHLMNWRFGGRNDNVSFVWLYEQIRFFLNKRWYTTPCMYNCNTCYNTHLNGMDEILVKAPQTENVELNKLIVLQHHPIPSINS